MRLARSIEDVSGAASAVKGKPLEDHRDHCSSIPDARAHRAGEETAGARRVGDGSVLCGRVRQPCEFYLAL